MHKSYHLSWSILPATQCLFGKLKVRIEDLGKVWNDGTVLICERDNGFNRKPTLVFLVSSGKMNEEIGLRHKAHHDQTCKPLGEHKVIGKVFYEFVNGQLVTNEGTVLKDFDLNDKAPVFVFK